MTVSSQQFQQTRKKMLAQNGVVNRDGVGDGCDLVVGCPSHVGELIGFVGKSEGLNLHHSHPLHSVP